MFDLVLASLIELHRDDVESCRMVEQMIFRDEEFGGSSQTFSFMGIHFSLRFDVRVSNCFDFDKDHFTGIKGYNIEFASLGPKIPSHDYISLFPKEFFRLIFRPSTEI
jgi:hypothetical protein